MVLPVGSILEVKGIQKESFHEKIPYKGIYMNTSYDTLTLEAGWLVLAPSSPKVKIFTDSDVMKQNVVRTTSPLNVTVETLLELSDRMDEVEKKVNDLSARAITMASDFQKDSFWYATDSLEPMELIFPSHAVLRFQSSFATDRAADMLINYSEEGRQNRWIMTCPEISVAKVSENTKLPVEVIPLKDRSITGKNIVCKDRYLHYNDVSDANEDILSYTDTTSKKLLPIPYPLGDHAMFNDVLIREGYTLYLDDPAARIKIKKPKNV